MLYINIRLSVVLCVAFKATVKQDGGMKEDFVLFGTQME